MPLNKETQTQKYALVLVNMSLPLISTLPNFFHNEYTTQISEDT